MNRLVSIFLVVLLAGCGSQAPPVPQTHTTEDGTPQPREFPEPPDDLTSETAKQTALKYEAAYINRRLIDSTVDDFSAWSGQFPDAEVVNRTDDGYVVDVRMPYYYRKGDRDTDAFTRARYLVSSDTVRRTNGSTVSPVLTDPR